MPASCSFQPQSVNGKMSIKASSAIYANVILLFVRCFELQDILSLEIERRRTPSPARRSCDWTELA